MAKVSTFLYCEGVQNDVTPTGPKMHIIGPMQILTPMFIPSMFSFSVVIGIIDTNMKMPHKFRLLLKGPDEQIIIDTGESIIPINNAKVIPNLPEDMQGFMGSIDFRNVAIRQEGTYEIEVFFDDESMGKFPIKAKGVENK
jgi:hypothetical protein